MTAWDPDPEHWGADIFEDPIANAEAEIYRERPDPHDYADLNPGYRPPPPPDKLSRDDQPAELAQDGGPGAGREGPPGGDSA